MKLVRFFLVLFLVGGCFKNNHLVDSLNISTRKKENVFRLHLNTEPSSIRVWDQRTNGSNFLVQQLNASLLRFNQGELKPQLGECKVKDARHIQCLISKEAFWSNSDPILAEDFLRTFQIFLNPDKPALRADLLLPILNAEKILNNKSPLSKLGVTAKNKILTIELEKPDFEFIYTLSNVLISPTHKSLSLEITSGPFKINKWIKKQKIILEPNNYYLFKNPYRPRVEFYFSSEDSVALSLYKKNEIDFLRRVPTLYIPKLNTEKDFFTVDQLRFDYMGFGPELKNSFNLRRQLANSLHYEDLQKIFWAKPRPGCLGIPAYWVDKVLCYNFENQNKLEKPLVLKYSYSKQGGDDHQRAAEWLQYEWEKNLGLKIELNSLENKVFLKELRGSAPAIFRKGLALDRPTCLATLETFTTGAEENFVKYSNPKFDQWVASMKTHPYTKTECRKGFEILMDDYVLIPTGPIYFSIMVKPHWTGWKLNELNQLDLSDLKLE